MKIRNYLKEVLEFSPTIVLLFFSFKIILAYIKGYVLIGGITVEYNLDFKNLFGLILVLLTTASFFLFKKYYRLIVGFSILLSVFGWVSYSPRNMAVFFGVNQLKITIHFPALLALVLLILVIIISPKIASNRSLRENLE